MAFRRSLAILDERFLSVSAILSTVFLAALLNVAYKAIYNLFWHPLAAYPGSVLRRAFVLPDAISLLRGTQYLEIQRLHAKYGHVVRIAPNSLSYSSSEAWEDIYALKTHRSELAKDPLFYKRRIGAQLLNATKAEHTHMRKFIAPFFSHSSLKQHEPLLNTYFDLFVAKLQKRIDEHGNDYVDLMAYFNFVTFDIIGDLVLGSPFGALDSGEYHSYIRNVFESIKMLGVLRFAANYPIAGLALGALQCVFPSLAAKRKAHMKFTQERVDSRLGRLSEKADLIAHILKDADDGDTVLTREEIISNCRVLLTAGSETTATHLTGVTWFLLTHPDKLKRTQDEIRSVFQKSEDITLRNVSQTDRLPYLNAVIQEGLRCYPSVPSILPRVTNAEGNRIAGRFVPGGISVGIHHYSAYRHPGNFHQPESFIPERWLADAPPCFDTDAREVLHPFHVGPRGCLGKGLAYLEIRSLLVRLLWHFELELKPGSLGWLKTQKEHALWAKPSLWVKLCSRRWN